MSEDIRVGDRFLVEVEVIEARSPATGDTVWNCTAKGGASWNHTLLTTDELLAAKRLPGAIKVGDKVLQRPGTKSGVVEWMDDIYALVRWPSCGLLVVPLDTLTLADEAAS